MFPQPVCPSEHSFINRAITQECYLFSAKQLRVANVVCRDSAHAPAGDNVAFTDSTEYELGHGVRSFKSIKDAYTETSMSRVYGGIHYMDGAWKAPSRGKRKLSGCYQS